MVKVSVVIPNYNGNEYLKNCIESLYNQDVKNFEIIVVDDCSTDDSLAFAKASYPESTSLPILKYVSHSKNEGFCKSVNDGIKMAAADYVILLNNDTVAMQGFVRNLYKAVIQKDNIFSVSSRMIAMHDKSVLDDTGDLYCALGWAFSPSKDKSIHLYKQKEKIFASCGGAAIYKKAVFEEIGYFDEKHFAYLEDIDIGYRAKLHGYINVYEPKAEVYHAGSASTGSRHNEFKVKISARNNLYMIYKNMPDWQLIINSPFIMAGMAIKTVYFAKKGLAIAYIKGLKDGYRLITKEGGAANRVDFKKVSKGRQLLIEWELLANTLRRLKG